MHRAGPPHTTPAPRQALVRLLTSQNTTPAAGTSTLNCAGWAGPAPRLRMHPSSVLARAKPPYLLFHQAQQDQSGW